jgi:DNA-binding beta-propeller fold protein YncE
MRALVFALASLPLLAAAPAEKTATKVALPAPAPVFMDYIAYDAATGQVWVPAGNTGKVFVLDPAGNKFRSVEGFATKVGRGDRLMGPSSVYPGKGAVYVGNRGDSSICAIDAASLARKGCVELPSSPDGTAYVATTDEVWVTTPRESSFQIVDAKDPAHLKLAGKMVVDGQPEGYAVDPARGLLYTNLEDKDRTLVIDVKARKVVSTFDPGCGKDGPRGLSIDPKRNLLLVACTDAVVSMDAKSGVKKGRIETGKGVDNIDYDPGRKLVYAAAGQVEKLTIASVDDAGAMTVVSTAQLPKGVRVVVIDSGGNAYGADSAGGALWVVKATNP